VRVCFIDHQAHPAVVPRVQRDFAKQRGLATDQRFQLDVAVRLDVIRVRGIFHGMPDIATAIGGMHDDLCKAHPDLGDVGIVNRRIGDTQRQAATNGRGTAGTATTSATATAGSEQEGQC
jgi:hypothetical protein